MSNFETIQECHELLTSAGIPSDPKLCLQTRLQLLIDNARNTAAELLRRTSVIVNDNPKVEVSETGAKRAKLYPKLNEFPIRIDLVFNNPIGLRRLAETYGEGSLKYGANNWKGGFKESVFLSHALEHIRLHFEKDTEEDHIAHACWNLFTLMHFQETQPELMDITGENPE